MWILRFHRLKSKEYNKITRICKRYGFCPRSHPSIVFAKASLMHATQNTSFRALSREYGVDYAGLAKFYRFASTSGCLREFFHVFLECRACLYIEDIRYISEDILDHNAEILTLTEEKFESMMRV